MGQIRVWSDGQPISEPDAPAQLEMEAEDWQMYASSGQRYLLNKEPIALLQNVVINQGYILS